MHAMIDDLRGVHCSGDPWSSPCGPSHPCAGCGQWTEGWWNSLSVRTKFEKIAELRGQIQAYLQTPGARLRIDFRFFVPQAVTNMVNSLPQLIRNRVTVALNPLSIS
jgi:hypothetical protein